MASAGNWFRSKGIRCDEIRGGHRCKNLCTDGFRKCSICIGRIQRDLNFKRYLTPRIHDAELRRHMQ